MKQSTQTIHRILRRRQVEERTGLSRSTIYARMSENAFPRPVNLGGGKAVGWIESEIDAWIIERIECRHSES
jgi:prophage regulatory protein